MQFEEETGEITIEAPENSEAFLFNYSATELFLAIFTKCKLPESYCRAGKAPVWEPTKH